MQRPHTHLFDVEAQFPPIDGPLIVALPVWTPGSYLVREFARHLQEVTAFSDDGDALPLERLDKKRFQISAPGRSVRLSYRVYANELTVRTSHLDGSHGYFNGATLFLYSEDLRHLEHRVAIRPHPGWIAFSALP